MRKIAVNTNKRQSILLGSCLQMAVLAGQIVTGEAFGLIGHFRADMCIGFGNQIAALPHDLSPGIVGQRIGISYIPGCLFGFYCLCCWRLLLFLVRHCRRCRCILRCGLGAVFRNVAGVRPCRSRF
ncbi:Uncharacterised protein [Brucella neotomae]|nr:Uncharacterised protein [Brucella neotomae]